MAEMDKKSREEFSELAERALDGEANSLFVVAIMEDGSIRRFWMALNPIILLGAIRMTEQEVVNAASAPAASVAAVPRAGGVKGKKL